MSSENIPEPTPSVHSPVDAMRPFWKEIYQSVQARKTVIIRGYAWGIGPEPASDDEWRREKRLKMLGCNGDRMEFRFKEDTPLAGKTLVSHNVWGRGHVPDEYKYLLPDNAELMGGAEK